MINENITYDEKVLVELILKFFPDFRRCINEVQRYGASGVIDSGLLATLSEEKLTPLIDMIADKNWSGMRKWVGQNSDNDFNTLYRKLLIVLKREYQKVLYLHVYCLLQTINTNLHLVWILRLTLLPV